MFSLKSACDSQERSESNKAVLKRLFESVHTLDPVPVLNRSFFWPVFPNDYNVCVLQINIVHNTHLISRFLYFWNCFFLRGRIFFDRILSLFPNFVPTRSFCGAQCSPKMTRTSGARRITVRRKNYAFRSRRKKTRKQTIHHKLVTKPAIQLRKHSVVVKFPTVTLFFSSSSARVSKSVDSYREN